MSEVILGDGCPVWQGSRVKVDLYTQGSASEAVSALVVFVNPDDDALRVYHDRILHRVPAGAATLDLGDRGTALELAARVCDLSDCEWEPFASGAEHGAMWVGPLMVDGEPCGSEVKYASGETLKSLWRRLSSEGA